LKALTEADLDWLEERIGRKVWTTTDQRRILADLRAEMKLPKKRNGLLALLREEECT
jgi:hypothetical protein